MPSLSAPVIAPINNGLRLPDSAAHTTSAARTSNHTHAHDHAPTRTHMGRRTLTRVLSALMAVRMSKFCRLALLLKALFCRTIFSSSSMSSAWARRQAETGKIHSDA